ncbi:hypothetical protein [Litoribacillus peritrichatus]|uniref:Uncharacterized protein n=1 Tax=Litoribacillus peritrichatus TaxID=718191 RepID=A0ABP7M707_9GAMM
MVHAFAGRNDKQQQEIAKWSVIFESLTPLKQRTLDILEERYSPIMRRFLENPASMGFLIEWDFSGSSLGHSHLEDRPTCIDPNQLLREISILEAYGETDYIRASMKDIK